MAALVDSHAGDDLRAGKMLGNPALLLRLRPVSARAARQDDWMEMRNCLEQVTRVRQQWQGGIEVARLGKPLPEGWQTMALLECARRPTADMLGTTVEIGAHAIAIEENLHQPNPAGLIRFGTGASSGRPPRAATTTLLWTDLDRKE